MDSQNTIVEDNSRDDNSKIVSFFGLNERQKKVLTLAGAGTGGIALGAVILSLTSFAEKGHDGKPIIQETLPKENLVTEDDCTSIMLSDNAPFFRCNDQSDFSTAYNEARSELGEGGIFEWNGNVYNTFTEYEWKMMDTESKNKFFESIDEKYITNQISDDETILKILNGDIDIVEDFELIDDADIYITDELDPSDLEYSDEDVINLEDQDYDPYAEFYEEEENDNSYDVENQNIYQSEVDESQLNDDYENNDEVNPEFE